LDVLAHRAVWDTHALTDYSYQYELTGFYINYAGHPIRLNVRRDTVQSAVFVATGLPVPGSQAAFPTIDALFDQAEAAALGHSLNAVVYDPRLGFPIRMDLAGPPDASGSVLASDLQPLP